MTGDTRVTFAKKNVEAMTGPTPSNTGASSAKTSSQKTWEKADRMLLEGRVTVLTVTVTGWVFAECIGDTGTYMVKKLDGLWSCSCPARVDCSHLRAVQRVTR